ncbi:MAG: PKD-like domain-containing protein [Cyclobacteriaceae bacterium]
MNQRLWRIVSKTLFLSLIGVGFVVGEVWGQLSATQARHETDAQTSTLITLSGNLGAAYTCVGACLTNWSITVGGAAGAVTSVIGAAGSNTVQLSFTPAVGIGQAVVVNHTNDGTINNIVNLASQNNRVVVCSDFSFIALVDNTPPCAPVTPTSKMVFNVIKGARNSSLYGANPIRVRVDWTGGTNFLNSYDSDGAGSPTGPSYTIAGDGATSGFSYPSNQTVCGYTSQWQIRISTTNCGSPNPAQFVTYASHNTDAAGEGDGSLITQPLIALTDQVCEGDFVNMRFTDVSDLNCIDLAAAPSPLPINSAQRNVRVIYGWPHTAGNTIRNVFVLGNQITDANGNLMPAYAGTGFTPTVANALGTPDAFGVVTVPAAVTGPRGPLETITSSSATLVGDVGRTFNITLQYWNVCNKYDGAGDAISNNKREITDQIIVVLAPTAPTSNDKEFCNSQNLASAGGPACPGACTTCFQMVPPGATTEIKWYNTLANANADASAIASSYGTNCRFLRPENRSGGLGAMAADGTYSVFARYRNGTGLNCLSPPVQVSITRRTAVPTPTGPIATSATNVCRGGTVTLTLPAANPNPPASLAFGGNTQYTWSTPSNWTLTSGAGTKVVTYSVGAAASFGATNITVLREFTSAATSGGNCPSSTININITVDSPPSITTQPSNQTICQDGGTRNFAVVASGTAPLTYQWQVDPDGAGAMPFANIPTVGGDPYSGETSATLTVNVNGTGVTLSGSQYRVIVTGVCTPTVTSAARTLTVNPTPSITTQPAAGGPICINGTKIYTVVAAGTPTLTYQWEVDPDGAGPMPFVNVPSVGGDPYTGETTASLTINTTGTGTSLDGARYRVVVNSTGCPAAVTSNQNTLSIQGPTVTITQGATASVCADNDLQLNGNEVFFNGSFASRAWTGTYDENFAAAPALIVLNNAQLDALLTDGVGGSRRTALDPIFNSAGLGASKVGEYVLTLTTTDDNGCPNSATITINVTEVDATILHGPTAPTATTPGNASICAGDNLFLDGNPSGGSGTYTVHTWTKQSGPGGAIGTLLSNPAIRNPTFNSAITGTYVLSYFVQDNGGCSFDTDPAGNITIVVNPLPVANNQTPAAICSTSAGGNTAVVDLTTLQNSINNTGTVTFAWFSNAGLTIPIATPNSATVTNATPVFARVTEIAAPNCFSSASVTYTINPTPPDAQNPVNAIACSTAGIGSPMSVDDPGAGFIVRWFNISNPTQGVTMDAVALGLGVASGARNQIFTPNSTATASYFAIVESTTVPTNCWSLNSVQVDHTEDIQPLPNPAVAGAGGQTCNTSFTMPGATLPSAGTGFWSTASDLYEESFESLANGTTVDNGVYGWTRGLGAVTLDPGGYIEVKTHPTFGKTFETNGLGNHDVPEAFWRSKIIDVSTVTNVDISLGLYKDGDLETDDYIRVYHIRDGGAPIQFGGLERAVNDGPPSMLSTVASVNNLDVSGNTMLEILVLFSSNVTGELQGIDNIIVKETGGSPVTFSDIFDPMAMVSNLQVGANTLFWNVATLGACSVTPGSAAVTRIALPIGVDVADQVCEDVLNGGTTSGIDLTSYDSGVSGGAANRSVSWFSDITRATPIATPANFTVSDGLTVYALITETLSGSACQSVVPGPGSVSFTVNTLPAANDPTLASRTFCEDVQGGGSHAGVNLDSYNAQINGGAVTITWYPTLADAQALTNQIAPGVAAGQVGNFTLFDGVPVVARVVDGNSCANFREVFPVISLLPADNLITGNDVDCSSATAVKVYQANAALNAFGTTHVYNWTVNGAGTNFEVFDGAVFVTTNNYTVTQSSFLLLVRFPNPGTFTFTLSETIDGCTGNTVNKVVNVSGAPPALVFNAPQTQVCKGQLGVTYSLTTAPQAGSNYVWTVVGGTVVGPSSGNITSITVNWGTLTAPQPSVSVTESNASGCAGAPASVNVFLNDNPVMVSPNSATICSGATPSSQLTFTATLGGAPPISAITFNWTVVSVPANVTGVVNGQNGVGQLTMPLSNVSGVDGIVTFEVTPVENDLPNPPNCTASPQTVFITVKPQPIINPGQTKLICPGTAVNYSIQVTPALLPATTTFSWAAPTMSAGGPQGAAQPGIAIGAAGTLHITDNLTNTTNAVITATYNVVPTNGTCVYPSVPVVISIEPIPTMVANLTSLPTQCSGDNVNINLTSPTVPNTPADIKWDLVVTKTAGTGAAGGTAFANLSDQAFPSAINGTLTNSGNDPVTIRFVFTPKLQGSSNCAGAPLAPIDVVVEPSPMMTRTLTTATTICDGGSVSFDLATVTTPSVPTDIKWDVTVSKSAGTGVAGGTAFANLTNQSAFGAAALSGTLTNSGNDAITVQFVFTPKLQGTSNCAGTPLAAVNVVVEPTPTMTRTLTTASTICNSGTVNFDLSTLTTPSVAGDIKWDVTVTKTVGTGAAGGTAFTNLTNQSSFAAGALNGTLTNSGNDPITVRFVFTPKLQGTSNCAGTPLAPIDVVVEPSPLMTRTLTTANTICDGGSVSFDLATVTTPSVPTDIKWDVTVSKSAGTGAAGGTAFANLTNQSTFGVAALTGTLTNSGNDAITVQFVFTPKLQGTSNCAGTPLAAVNVVVEPTPTMTRTLTTASTICNGGSVNFDLSTPTTPSVAGDIKWDVTVTKTAGTGAAGGTAFANLTNQPSFIASALNGTLTNSGNDPITVRFVFTPKLQGTSNCAGTPLAPVDVVVEPAPMMTRTLTTASTICNGDMVNFDLATVTTPSVASDIKWDVTVTQVGGAGVLSGTAFANLTNQTFTAGVATLNGTLLNSGSNAATARFVFTPKLQGTSNCAGVALAAVDVIVEPTPAMTRTLITSSTICNNGTVTFNLATTTSPSVAADIKWDVLITQTSGSGAVGGTGFTSLNNQAFTAGAAVFSGNLTNSGNDAATVRYVFTPKLQGSSNCPAASLAPIDVVVEPIPGMARTLTTSTTICSSGTVNFDLTTLTTPSTLGDIKWDVTVSKVTGAGVIGGTAFTNLTNQTFTAGSANLNGTLTNSGNDAATVRFIFTPKLQGTSNCAGTALAAVDVIVEPVPTMTRTLTTPAIICSGDNATFTLTTPTAPSVAGDIKWDVTVTQIGGTGAAGGTAFANLTNQPFVAGTAALNGTLTNSGNNVAIVRFVFTPQLQGSSNCPGVAMAPIDVQVEPTPIAVIGNSTPTVCNNGNVNILISSPTSSTTPADLKFDLTIASTNLGATGGTAFAALANQSFPVLIGGTLTNSSDNFITVTYTVTPKLQGTSNCPGVVPPSFTVIVEPTPKVAAVNNQPRLCNGGTPDIGITTVTNPSIPGNLTFDIVPTLPPGVTGTGNAASGVTSVSAPFSLNTGTLSNSTNISQTVVYTITPKLSGCVNGASQNVNVIVEPTPQVSLTNNLAKICNGGTPNITVTSPTSPSLATDLTFDVVVTLPGGVTGTGIAANGVVGASAPFSINAGTITNSNNTFETITYTVTPKLNGCADGPAQMVNVIVEPTPIATPTNNLPVICNGGTPDITIVSPTVPSVAGNLTFDVSVSLPAGVSGTGVAGSGTSGASAPFSVNTGTLTNSTNAFKTVVYTITPKLSGCANGTPQVVNVIVEPTPVAAFVNNSPNICTGSSPSIDITSPTTPNTPGNLTFDVTVSLPAGVTGTGVAGSGVLGATAPFSINTGTLTHDNLSNANLVVTYTITPKLAGCADGTPQVVNVTVRPIPVGAFDNSRIVCSDEAFTYNIQTANIDALGNQVASVFTYTVSSSDEANVPTPIGLDRTIASNAAINGNFNNANLAGADVDITYTITPFNASGSCAGAPFDVVVRVRPEPTAPALTTVDHCSDAVNPFVFDLQSIVDTGIGGNSVPSNFSYTVSSTNPLAVFPESNKPVADGVPISHIYSNFSSNDVTITYVVTPFSQTGNCQGTNFQFKIVVHPEPVGSNVVDPKCSTTLNYNIQSQITNGLTSVFTYTVSSDNGGVPAGPDRVVASNAPITDMYTNGTGLPANVTYTITPFNAANPTCAGTPFTYTVNVSPNPTGVSDTKAAKCSDVAFVEDPQNNIVPAVASTFTWTATYDFGLTGGLGSGTGVIAETLHNETAGQLLAHYTVIPTAGTCVGAAFFIDIPVDAEPVMLPGLANPAAVCSTNAVSTTPIGVILETNGVSVAADTYIISIKSIEAGLVASGGNQALPNTFPANSPSAGQSDAISNDTYRNTTSAQLKVVYTVTPVSIDGCQGNAFDITVPINPEPVLTTPVWPDVCSSNTGVSNPVNIVLGTNGTSANAVSYQLIDRQYSDGGPFGPGLPTAFTPDAGNAVIMAAPGSINLVKSDKFNNKSTVAVTVRYTIQGFSSQGCVSELLDYNVVVNPEPDLFVPAPGLVCSDVTTGITLTEIGGSATATSFHINNIIRQAGLIAGGSNASIGLNQPNNAIFSDIFTNTTASPLTVTYKVAPVTAAGCAGAQKDIVITITPAPAVSSSLNRTVCSDAPASIVLATEPSSAAAGSYRIDNITLAGVAGDIIPNGAVNLTVPRTTMNLNEISGDRFVNTTNNPLTVTYRITAIGSAAPFCEGPFRDVVLTVEPTILATPNNINATICSATPTDIELLSPSVPTAGAITFNYIAVSSIGGQMTGFIPALNNLPAGYHIADNLVNNSNSVATVTYTITAVANGAANSAGCSSVGVPIVVNVEPKPKLTASPLLQTVCESDGVNVSPTNILLTTTTMPSVGTMEFQVISAVPTGGMTLQPATSPLKMIYLNGETIADQWNNPTLTDQTVTYTLQPVVNGGLGCPGDNVVVTITVKPRPILNPAAPVVVCSGEFRSVPLVTDIPGTFATWTVVDNPNVTGDLNGGGASMELTLFNTGFNVETVVYTVTPKFNNCDGIPITVNVTVNPTPNVVGLPPTQTVCDGGTLNVPLSSSAAGTTFDWVVTDVFNLEAPGFFDGSGTTINQVINNPNGFQAVLIYQVTPRTAAGCVGLPRIMNVNVGSIVANVTPDRTDICSGQRIQMTNSTLGATSHRWFYRVQGTTTEIDVRTTPFVNYQLDNTTSTNPLVYEIVYQAKNGLCTVPDVVTPITVYRNVIAGFNEGTVPPIIGGTSTVNFTNTSNPVDGAQFRYEWDFGSASFANPPTFVGATPPPVIYSQQGPYQITLKAINIAGEVAGLTCDNMFTKTIVVPVLPLVADFTLDPPAGCFPTTVRVIENKSTGDIMEWKVVDSNGGIVAVSGQDLPEFFISTPGLFNVQLTTRDSFTDQVEFANADFEIYEVPIASFQARPATVFVPDTELTTFNFSTKANFYQWDFGDGETSDEREPKHVYKIEGVYDIVLVAGFDHDNGVVCTDTLSQKIIAKQGGITRVPNAFTPNPAGPSGGLNGGGTGSGGAGTFNDVFLPIVKGVEEFNMQIFDRWGNLIFESNNANQGWDGYDRNGRILPAGVYVYKLTLRLSDGQRTTQIGDITMIR